MASQGGEGVICVFLCNSIGLVSILYRDSNHLFLLCMGREEVFKHNLADFTKEFVGGASLKMGIIHPYRLLVNILSLSFIVLVPIIYYKIFTFRKIQDISVSGMVTVQANYS